MQRHSTAATTTDKSESHKFYFQGAWLPPVLFNLLIGRKISGRETLLILMIQALTNPNGRGCYASDSYLARQLGVEARELVNRMIRKLVKLGLLVISGSTRGREIVTVWNKPTTQLVTPSVTSACDVLRHTEVNPKIKKKEYTVAQNGERMEPLVASAKSSKHVEPSQSAYQCADQLHDTLVKNKVYTSRYNRTKSASAFETLKNEVGAARVLGTLCWYTNNYTYRYKPTVMCGTSFRKKFAAIEAAMTRQQRDNPVTEVSAAANEIVRFIGPVTAQANQHDLAVAVELSLQNLVAFKAKLKSVAYEKCGPFVWHLLTVSDLKHHKDFIQNWFRDLLKWYKGKLVPNQVISLDSQHFQKWGLNYAKEWGDVRDWNKLMKEIGHVD